MAKTSALWSDLMPLGTARKRLRALFWSYDFGISILAGTLLYVLAQTDVAVRNRLGDSLLAVAGISAGFAALALAAMAAVPPLLSRDYRYFLLRTESGVAGVLTPFAQVVSLGAGSAMTALVASIAWPAVNWSVVPAIQVVVAVVPIGLLCWAVLGAVQVVHQFIAHARADERAQRIVADRLAATGEGEESSPA